MQPENLGLLKIAHFCKTPPRAWPTSEIDSTRDYCRKIPICNNIGDVKHFLRVSSWIFGVT
jgi:hypothetical protein